MLVELHWGFIDWPLAFSLDLLPLWERLVSVCLLGRTVRSLSPEDLLIFLCLHGTKPRHRWRRLNWICDVAWLIRAHPGLNWGQVLAEARRLGSERRLLLGLCLAEELLDAEVPKQVRQRMLADPATDDLTAQVYKGLWSGLESCRALRGPRFDCKTLERGRDKARFLCRRTLASTVLRWALRSPHRLAGLYGQLDRTASRHPWLWPLPLFALLSGVYRLLLPVRTAAKGIASAIVPLKKD